MGKLFASLLICVISSINIYSQTFEKIKLDNKLSILNDKVFFNFPSDAKNEARKADIMSTDYNINKETRIVFDIGDKRLVFFAQELFALADKDVLQSIEKLEKPNEVKIQTNKDDLMSILSTPIKYDSTNAAILINRLYVKTSDNTVFRISAYINPEAYKIRKQYQQLTENIFNSISNGNRVNNRTAHQEKFKIFGTEKSLTFQLPADYTITVDQKYDFQVFKFIKYQYLSDTNWAQILIYNGNHPSLVYKDYGLSENDAKKTKGFFLGEPLDWLNFEIKDEDSNIYFNKEQKLDFSKIRKGLQFHISIQSNNKEIIEQLTKIVESIELSN